MPSHVDDLDAILTLAVADGARGEATLLQAWEDLPEEDRTMAVSALGEADGPRGVSFLRAIAEDGSALTDERCAALIALAKREGVRASDVFSRCLRDERVRDYAIIGLGCVGDDRAWSAVFTQLHQELAGSQPAYPNSMDARTLSLQSRVLRAAIYLGRHITMVERETAVIQLVQSKWDHLHVAEQDWFRRYWPACVPGGSVAAQALRPNPDLIAHWLSHPILSPLYVKPDCALCD